MSLQRVHDSILTCIGSTPLVRLSRCFPELGTDVLAKLEMLNPAGSMKDRPARFIVERGLKEGTLRPGMRLVESTSGNFGVALAMVARLHQLHFTAVVDPNTASANLRLLEIYGADVQMVTEADHTGGYLGSRVRRARQLAASSPTTVWINQYANELNWRAYYETAGTEILAALDPSTIWSARCRLPAPCSVSPAACASTRPHCGWSRSTRSARSSSVVLPDLVRSPATARAGSRSSSTPPRSTTWCTSTIWRPRVVATGWSRPRASSAAVQPAPSSPRSPGCCRTCPGRAVC